VTPENGAIRQGNWKLVGNRRISANYTGNKPEIDTFELFNLADDLYEKNDLSEKYPDKLKELQDRLKSYAARRLRRRTSRRTVCPKSIISQKPGGIRIRNNWMCILHKHKY